MRLIGLAGRRGSGKTTVAEILRREHGFREVAFADPLKDAVRHAFGLSEAQVHDPLLKETPDAFWGVTPRALLQAVGTDLFRDALARAMPRPFAHTSVWILACERRLLSEGDGPVVISDVRFEDEAAFVRRCGGSVWLVDRGDGGDGVAGDAADRHASERLASDMRADADAATVVRNRGSLADLAAEVRRALSA